MRQSRKRMLIAGVLAAVYLLIMALWGSPLLALTTWLGLVDPV